MKKSLSLLLAMTLLFSMSVFATDVTEENTAIAEENVELYATAPASKVYLFKSFDEYASAEDYIASLSEAASIADFVGARVHAAKDAPDTVWKSNPTVSTVKFKENAFGHIGVGMNSSSSTLQFIPEETWNYLQNTDESYVISFDVAADPKVAQTNYVIASVYMADTYDEEAGAPYETITSQNLKWLACGITPAGTTYTTVGIGHANQGTEVKTKDIYPGEAYTYAIAFHNAGVGKEDDNYRRIIIDADLLTKDTLINRNPGTDNSNPLPFAQGMIGKDTISGFKWIFDSKNGIYLSDIKIYTVKDAEGSFFVKMDDTTNISPTSESVKVKFSQPVAKKAITADKISLTANGIAFTDFKVGKISTYVDNTTKEIGTEVELIFPYGLSSNTTYEVTVNSAIKNEIQKLSLGSNNTVSFTTAVAPTNVVSLTGEAGLGGGEAITALETGKQAKFTAKVDTAAEESYILLGVYDSSDNLVSYTYAKVNQGEEISLASKIDAAGMKVKAFSAGNLLDLEAFSNADDAKIQ